MTDALVEKRFWSKVSRRGNDDCWPWNGSKGSGGYGSLRVSGKTKRAHRLAYEFCKGEIPAGMYVCHSCDNRPCCNPGHLWIGTHGDNVRDCVRKGRHVRPDRDEKNVRYLKGSQMPFSKLTEEDVRSIRAAVAAGELQNSQARKYGVDKGLISQIINGKIWRHVWD